MDAAGRLPPQPWMTADETRAVVAALTAGGAEVRFVGGCVRDALAGRPVTDVDIATHDPPETVIALLQAADLRAVPTGISHGTVTAVVGKAHFEVTTLRRDVETFGRHARVEYTDDWRADAARRDFTMNALFCAPDGTLYDPFGGLEDLRAGRVRFVGAAGDRIREDVLRLLRFFRFYAYYGAPPPDAEALVACRALAGQVPTLSAERVWSETRRLLQAPDPAPVFALMEKEGVLGHVIAGRHDVVRLGALVAIEQELGEVDALRRLAALADAAGAESLAARFRLSRAEAARLARIGVAQAGFAPLVDSALRARWYYRHAPQGNLLYRDLLLLYWAGRRAAGEESREEAKDHAAAAAEATEWVAPKFPLRGRDGKAIGIADGPRLGALLAAAEEWWVEGGFAATRQDCLDRFAELAGGEDTT